MILSKAGPVFALPPGVDFGRAFIHGLRDRHGALPPEAFARIEIYVNTRRMQRRLVDLFDQGPPGLLPRIRVITDLGQDLSLSEVPLPVPPLRRRLELMQLVRKLLDQDHRLAPRSAIYDLSDSLARLMDEMNGEGLGPDAFDRADTSEQSDHWARSMQFLQLVAGYLGQTDAPPDAEARQRLAVDVLARRWATTPPNHPVIIAGSTGSRGATSVFMRAVAQLPLGALVLPGFDFDLPDAVWDSMSDQMSSEDHPQYRFRALMTQLGIERGAIEPWSDAPVAAPARNKLISLSLRPAPVTDQWREDGPSLGDMRVATTGLTLIEAPNPRAEAETIALRLRAAIDRGQTAALITPDRMLTRKVAAALDRWSLAADDSAGQPLALSPPGRFLRLVGQMIGQRLDAGLLLSVLKHPICHSGGGRGDHLRHTHNLELFLRRAGSGFPKPETLAIWAKDTQTAEPGRLAWANWLSAALVSAEADADALLTDHTARHIALAEALSQGAACFDPGELWLEGAGRTALAVVTNLTDCADAGGLMPWAEYLSVFNGILNGAEVRNPETGHPDIKIWGTLEARVQNADLIILGGMNDGVWPEVPGADPWLNRQMRKDIGLTLPERRVGLSAHDYQQAVAGPEVWISRAIRSNEAETVASRWVFRLTNLLDGLPDQDGPKALAEMRERGQDWLTQAALISAEVISAPKAHRPSPRPPIKARPKSLSVTQIETLIRDPYEIYARKVLGLNQLDPLVPEPDGRLRGTIFHKVMERFIGERPDFGLASTKDRLIEITQQELEVSCPWPTHRRMWLAHMERIADVVLEMEVVRQGIGTPTSFEQWGEVPLDNSDFVIGGKADRIDLTESGAAILYDYKTGALPSEKQQIEFNKQLLLEAAMIEKGAFKDIGARTADACFFVGLGSDPKEMAAPLDKEPAAKVWHDLGTLIGKWAVYDRGYSSRIAMQKVDDKRRFDQLARLGEWDLSHDPKPEDLT